MRFGILGTADIARGSMIPAIGDSEHEVAAVASRDGANAQSFIDDLGLDADAYEGYEALFDADIDAVYNPLPNGLHAEWTEKAADAGLHVLCEKPLTVDADEAERVFEHCEDAGVTVMEAFMYQFHPATARIREIVADELSTVRNISSVFTFSLDDPEDIRVNPDLGGGSLMDVGCYPVSGIRGILGEPERVHANAVDTMDSGVDTEMSAQLEYEDATGQVWFGFDTPHRQHLRVDAENGYLEAENVYNPGADDVELTYSADGETTTEVIDGADSYRLEVEAFVEAAERGEEPPVSEAETLANMRAIDALYESAEENEPVALD